MILVPNEYQPQEERDETGDLMREVGTARVTNPRHTKAMPV
jgi:hypothetical protein